MLTQTTEEIEQAVMEWQKAVPGLLETQNNIDAVVGWLKEHSGGYVTLNNLLTCTSILGPRGTNQLEFYVPPATPAPATPAVAPPEPTKHRGDRWNNLKLSHKHLQPIEEWKDGAKRGKPSAWI